VDGQYQGANLVRGAKEAFLKLNVFSNRRKPTYVQAPAQQAKVTKVSLVGGDQNLCFLRYLLFEITACAFLIRACQAVTV
jgi:hypothetical protein